MTRTDYFRKRRASLLAERKCVQCRAGLQPDDGARCVECAEKHRESAKASYAKPEVKTQKRERIATLAEQRNAEGLCGHCGKNAKDGELKWCRPCLQRNKEYSARCDDEMSAGSGAA